MLMPMPLRLVPRLVPRHTPGFGKVQHGKGLLETTGWDKNSPPPELPPGVVERTRDKYREAYERLTGTDLPSGGSSDTADW
jgi:phosphoribosylaminoimidazole-succinocarboxamide synthase